MCHLLHGVVPGAFISSPWWELYSPTSSPNSVVDPPLEPEIHLRRYTPGKGDSYWKPSFFGAMLVSGRVRLLYSSILRGGICSHNHRRGIARVKPRGERMAPENGPQPSAESLAQRGVDSSLGQCGANVGPDPLARFRVHGQAGPMGKPPSGNETRLEFQIFISLKMFH